MPNPNAPAADADTGAARAEGFSSVSDAVAELDRRDRERAAARKAQAPRGESEDDAPAKPRRARAQREADDQDAEDDGDRRQVEEDSADDDEVDAKTKRKAEKTADDDVDHDDEGDDDGDDQAGGDDDGEGDDAGDDDEGDEKPEPRKAEKAPQKVKINLGDREVEATPDEVSSYLRESHAERQQVTQARQQIIQQAQALQQHEQMLAQIAQAMLGQEPPLEMAQSDPGAYIAHQAQHRQRQALVQQLQQQMSQASQIAQAQQQQAFSHTVERERAALLKAVPELADPSKLAAFNGRVVKVAQQYGYTAQELSGAFDHRTYLMLRDLGRLADIDADRARVREKLKKAPVLKTPETRSSSGQRTNSSAGMKSKDALRAFLKSGRTMRDVKAYLARTER